MNILHYSLGFPPYRTGGLTKFCMDLMTQQVSEGHKVSLLWPGEILFGRTTHIKQHASRNGIASYEVLNPAPVSYDEGILDIELFMEEGTAGSYDSFLEKLAPDVIHIHTLMGIHKNLLISAKKLGIRLVFSVHDFFPICPKVTMFRDGAICKSVSNCEKCAVCNLTALSARKMILLQSGAYRALKDSAVVKSLRKRHRDAYLSEESAKAVNPADAVRVATDYQALRAFYKGLIDLMDVIHYNSSVTKKEYEKYLQPHGVETVLLPITHADIQPHKMQKNFDDFLRITYLGPASTAKGYFLLKDALDQLWYDPQNGRKDFCLNVFFQPAEIPPYMNSGERYDYHQLGMIMEHTDVLVAPSLLYETFGYTVQEALSYGIPVIVSDTVGAKDIVPDGGGMIIADITADKLAEAIRQIDREKLQRMNGSISSHAEVLTISSISKAILEMCYHSHSSIR